MQALPLPLGRDRKIRTAEREKKLTSLLNKRYLGTKREFRLIVSWEAIHIIGRSFTVWTYFPLLSTELFLLISRKSTHTHAQHICFGKNVDKQQQLGLSLPIL